MTQHVHAPAQVPATALGPAIPKAGYLVEEIADGLFSITDGLYQMMFLVTGDGIVAVDAPPTLGANIPRGIASVSRLAVTHAVYSHHHADHVGAMVLYEGATLHAHHETARLLQRAADPNRPQPQSTFTDSARLECGGGVLELSYHGPIHSPGNIFIYAPTQQVLMLVDVIYPGWVPFAALAMSQDIPAWLDAPAQALEYPFETFIGGHLTRLGSRDDVVEHQEYLSDLERECRDAIDTVNLGSAEVLSDPWAVFRAYLDGVAHQAAANVAERWRDRLGGVAAFTDMNAWALVESLRIDAGELGPFGIRN